MLCSVAAGALLGVGAGLILRSGASSGGFDVFAVILNKKFDVPVATVLNLCDAAVIVMQALGQPLVQTLYGLLVIFISAAIVNRVITLGAKQSHITIYSDHHDEIRSALLGEADVGMTSYLAETGFPMKNIKYVKREASGLLRKPLFLSVPVEIFFAQGTFRAPWTKSQWCAAPGDGRRTPGGCSAPGCGRHP